MYALKVQINEEAPIVAGAEDLCVLNTVVNCIGKLGSGTRTVRENEGADLFLTIGGLTSRALDVPDDHLNWVSQRPSGASFKA